MSKRAKKEKRPVAKIDFKPYGAAIKAGRTKQKESRNKAADALFISPRYLANIENKGQHPSVQVFLELMSRYHISVDQILHGETMEGKSTERMQNGGFDFRAAVSLRLHKPMTTCRDTVADGRLICRVHFIISLFA